MGSLKPTLDSSTHKVNINKSKMRISLFVSVLTFCQLVSCHGPLPALVGRWVEDESLRTGLNDFLWARGVNWFKRQYATALTTWQYEQTIIWRNGGYQVSGVKGPQKEVFGYKLTPDNRTIEIIDLGSSLGGKRETTCEVVGSSLVSYCLDPKKNKIDLIATRTIDPNNPNVMYYKTKDIPYDHEMVATMRRQN